MLHHWKAHLLFSVALPFAASGIVPQTARAQINGFDHNDANSGESAATADASSIQVLGTLSIASAPPHDSPELPAAGSPPGAPDTMPVPPKPQGTSNQNWHVSITPYLWLAGVHGTVGALGRQASVHASFGDLLEHFNFGLMVAVEPRYKRILMPFDFMWMKLSDDKQLAFDAGATSAKATVNQDILTQKIGFYVVDGETFKLDGAIGLRYWHSGNTLTVNFPLRGVKSYQSANWVDAVAGGRIQARLSPKLVLTVMGDAGGGGANLDYQIAGLIGWKLKKFTMLGGWRYLSVNYRPGGGFIYDMTSSGLLMGVTIPLN